MRAIRYSLHFSLLAVAGLILWPAKDLELPASIDGFRSAHFGLIGLLHASAVVASLRDRKAALSVTSLCFIGLAAAWSIATPMVVLWTSFVLYPVHWFIPRSTSFSLVLLLYGSAVGSSGYWLLVRRFWIRSLRRVDLLKTLVLCVAATLLVTIPAEAIYARVDLRRPELWNDGSEVLLTVAWWCAFSLSLYWSEARTEISRANIAFVIAAAVSALALVMWSFELASGPLDRQARADKKRLSDLKSIAGSLHVDWEDAQDKKQDWKAPAALKNIPTVLRGVRLADPANGVPYDYAPLSGSAYELCAVFDSDSSAQGLLFTESEWTFSKGRHCFALDASKSPYEFGNR